MHDSRVGLFCEELSMLLESGMVLGDALGILADEREGDSDVNHIYMSVQSGASLSDAMGQVFASLSPWILSVVRTTESASVPEAGLTLISNHLREEERWKTTLQRSLGYPLVLLAATIFVGIFVTGSVLPTLMDMVSALGGAVPLSTRLVLQVGSILGSPVSIVLWGIAVGSALWLMSGRGETPEYVIRIPVVKRLVFLSEAWRFFSINDILLTAGMPLHEALGGSATVLKSKTLAHSAHRVAERVQGGVAVEDAIREMFWLPPRTSKVLAVAVSAHSIARGFRQMTRWAEEKRNALLYRWNTWLPVVVLCAATVLIGLLAHAILIPAFTIDLGP